MRFRHLSVPIEAPVRTSFGTMATRPAILVELEEADGVKGVGESWCNFPAWAPWERMATLDGIRHLVEGQEVHDVAKTTSSLLQRLAPLTRQWGAPGPVHQAVSAVDIALWDVQGQMVGKPLHSLLGGPATSQVPVYASGLGPPDPVGLAAPLYESGVRLLKLKVGFGRERDAAHLAALREAYPDAEIALDANQAWTHGEAVHAVERLLAQGPCRWLEEPVPADELETLQALRQELAVPIAGGENYYGLAGFERVLDARALDVVQPDVAKTGGVSQAFAVAAATADRGLHYAPHYLGGAVGFVATLHCFAAAGRNGLAVEMDANPNPLASELLQDPLHVRDGFVGIPEGPGLGLALNEDVVERYTVARST